MGRTTDGATTRLLWLMAAVCLAAVGAALLAQYRFDMRPCPWCVLQRGIYLVMAVAFGLGAALGGKRRARAIPVGLGLLLAGAGAASALYQHLVAAQQFSCNRTLADRIVAALQLDETLPSVFSATATCAEAAVSVFGIPFAYWSLALFVALGIGSVLALRPRKAAR
jgi:disulfide bond formation protein DsbB